MDNVIPFPRARLRLNKIEPTEEPNHRAIALNSYVQYYKQILDTRPTREFTEMELKMLHFLSEAYISTALIFEGKGEFHPYHPLVQDIIE